MASPCSLIPRVGSSSQPLFWKSSQKSKQSRLLCPQLLLDSYLHPVFVQVVCLLRWHSTPMFYLRHMAVLWTHWAQIHTDPLGEGLAMLLPFANLSHKSSCMTSSCLESMVKCSKKPTPRLIALSWCLFLCQGMGQYVGTTSSSVPGKAVPPLPDALQEGKLSCLTTQRILRPYCLFQGLSPPSQQVYP